MVFVVDICFTCYTDSTACFEEGDNKYIARANEIVRELV